MRRVLLLGLLLGILAFPAIAGASSQKAPLGTPVSHSFQGISSVGPLFPPQSTTHICTASVVASRTKNLLITAAHCLAGSVAGWTFAPGFHNGLAPHGYWTITKAYGSPQWTADQNPKNDVAILVVAPKRVKGRVITIQSVTGANTLVTEPASRTKITVPAYPAQVGGNPLTCATMVYYQSGYPAFNCNSYVAGTSGAPWIVHTSRGSSVVGVIGGLHQGGCYPWTSYSSPFTSSLKKTYANAARGLHPTTFPVAGGDGCTGGP